MSVFAIWNMATGEITTTCPTRELIAHNYHNPTFRPRGPEQVICEFPDEIGLTIFNYREYPTHTLFEGMQRYIEGNNE